MSEVQNRPDVKANNALAQRQRFSDSGVREQHSAAVAASWQNPQTRENRVNGQKARLAEPETRARRLRQLDAIRPSPAEMAANEGSPN